MKKLALALSTALLLVGLAGPASAFVIDKQDLVSAADEKKLVSALERLGNHRFEVLFVDRTPGAPSETAKKTFKERGLSDKDGVIVVAVESRKVGVYVGDGFTRRGVSDAVVSERIKADFLPHAKQGEYARGAATLAKNLVDTAGKGVPAGDSSTSSSTSTEDDGDAFLGFIILLVFIGGPIAGIVLWRKSRNSTLKELKERLAALTERREQIVNGSLKLAEIDALARFQEGEHQQAYHQLAKGSQQALERGRKFAEQFDVAKDALKGKQFDEAEKALEWLEREATMLSAHVSASLSALAKLEAGDLTGPQALKTARLPERVQDLASRLADAELRVSRESRRAAELSVKPLPELVDAIGSAHATLGQQPIDLEKLEKHVQKAESGSKKFLGYIATAEKRKREDDDRRAADSSSNVADVAWTAAIVSTLSSRDSDGSSSDSGWDWGSSSDSSWDSGSSSDDSW